ncbi:putative [histone H3]-lysine(4) N-trimethyltransferase [Helianthus annuus]|nr:putative [histone H3]-lysine(4) N-trimethyltransferase [Helianthus annuus]
MLQFQGALRIMRVDVGHQFFSPCEMVTVGFHNHWLSGIDYIGASFQQCLDNVFHWFEKKKKKSSMVVVFSNRRWKREKREANRNTINIHCLCLLP